MEAYVHVRERFPDAAAAFARARQLLDEPDLEVIGDFVVPPADGAPSRDFQTLHFDFGLPVRPVGPADVARCTALYVSPSLPISGALTRLVPLRTVTPRQGREWPGAAGQVRRLHEYGRSHGPDDDLGYCEGSFARVCEALLAPAASLPSLKDEPGFLCGTEFAALDHERAFLSGLGLEAPEVEVWLAPGELLVFDNLQVAHGRRGTRGPGELHQRVFGHRDLPPPAQHALRDQVLAVLTA